MSNEYNAYSMSDTWNNRHKWKLEAKIEGSIKTKYFATKTGAKFFKQNLLLGATTILVDDINITIEKIDTPLLDK